MDPGAEPPDRRPEQGEPKPAEKDERGKEGRDEGEGDQQREAEAVEEAPSTSEPAPLTAIASA